MSEKEIVNDWQSCLEIGWNCGHELLNPNQVHYCDYISLNPLLDLVLPHASSAKRREFETPDEVQFVVVHQIFELAFCLHQYELRRVIQALDGDDLELAVYLMKRIIQWTEMYSFLVRLLFTMTPGAFESFRELLKPASGAESEAFRAIELLSGIENDSVYAEDRDRQFSFREFLDRTPEQGKSKPKARWWTENLSKIAKEENLAQSFNSLLTRRKTNLIEVLTALDSFSDLRMLANLLYKYESVFIGFRRVHLFVVEYQIGQQGGTGHTSGALYLSSVINRARFFPKLWEWKYAHQKIAGYKDEQP